MRTIVIQNSFGLDHLALTDRPISQAPKRGEVLVKLKAASLNYRDYLMVTGGYGRQRLPLVPVSDGVGEVVAVGEDVQTVQVGDRVTPTFFQGWIAGDLTRQHTKHSLGGPLDGTLQDFMTVRADSVVRVPAHLTDVEAATLPCAALTAWSALITQGQLKPGDSVAIQGTGGVALFALQFAKMVGARVAITSKSDAKLERCKALGADLTINYRATPKWGDVVRQWTNGKGVDHVIELGGAETLKQSLRAIRPAGHISMIGVLSGSVAELVLPLVVMQNICLQGVTVGSRTAHEAMARAIEAHHLRPVIDRTFALEEARAAFDYLSQGQHFGKVCIQHTT